VSLCAWEFGNHPLGLNVDEASIGYKAHSLGNYGFDRNGNSYPVNLVAWGSGQNAAYAYPAMPFVAKELTPTTVRLPIPLVSCASILLLYYVASSMFGRMTALFAAFLLAISPWHIMLSRWALEDNSLPAVFIAGFACVVTGVRQWRPRNQGIWLVGE
jgi:dolichyl-phosphate-mannose--protein O-mannosyl transferase